MKKEGWPARRPRRTAESRPVLSPASPDFHRQGTPVCRTV